MEGSERKRTQALYSLHDYLHLEGNKVLNEIAPTKVCEQLHTGDVVWYL